MDIRDVTYRRLCQVAYVPWARLRRLLAGVVFDVYEHTLDWRCDTFESFTKYGPLLVMVCGHGHRFLSNLQWPGDWRQDDQ